MTKQTAKYLWIIVPFMLILFIILGFINEDKWNKQVNRLKAQYELTLEINENLTEQADSLQKEINNDHELFRDYRLFGHYIAIKYDSLKLKPKNVAKIINELSKHMTYSKYDPAIIYGVAKKETGFRAGTAKYNNIHGFKRARSRFTWSSGRASRNNAIYDNWIFSILDMYEYLESGAKNWSAYDKSYYEVLKQDL